jgi:hypothetical protein
MTTYYVACRDDRRPDGTKGRYVMSSRTFTSIQEAATYKKSISSSRDPMILVEVKVSDEQVEELIG